MKKMKIAYFSIEFPPRVFGGLGVYADFISRELTSLGNEIVVFTWGDQLLKRRQGRGGVTACREIPLPLKDSIEIFLSHETHAWGEGLDFLYDLLSYNQLAASRFMEEGPFDICAAHDWLGLPGAMAVKRMTGTPLIYHVHSTEIGRSLSPNPQLVSLEIKGASISDAIITVSESMKDLLVGQGFPKEKVYVCHNGVDTKAFSPSSIKPNKLEELRSSYGIGENDCVILFLGRLEPVKGAIQLIQAMPYVLEKNPNSKLIIVGRGTLEESAKKAAEPLGDRVEFNSDFLDLASKVHHYALADLCVFPSLYEPFGIVALEAAAMEKASVVGASGTSGLREIVENPTSTSPTGVHVNPHDPRDIAWGINLALEDKSMLETWGKNARKRCLENFTWSIAAEKTIQIYREVLQKGI